MLGGFLVGGKSYASHKYFFVLLIVCGAIMFVYKADEGGSEDSNIGYALIAVSLLLNGGTAGVQEKMRSVKRPSALHLMLFMNMWSSIFLTFYVAVSGESLRFIEFCSKHPEVLIQIGLVLAVGSCGQLFLSALIVNFGVVACCLVMTVRKFFSVLFSVLFYGNALSIRQGIATTIIFVSLLADALLSARLSRDDKKDDKRYEKSENIQVDEQTSEKMKQVLNETNLV
jgi:solute carrier family 35 (UDP-galactose transporter), member B1